MSGGDIYWVKFGKTVGTEIRKNHPALIISNNWQNEKGSRVVVLPMSSKVEKIYPFDVYVGNVFNHDESKIMCKQVKFISKKRLIKPKLEKLSSNLLVKVEATLKKVLGLKEDTEIRYLFRKNLE